ncbi:hypothetical protein EDB85DRAFT_1032954 [Lactarius pseudohatsudake]|nr:hypothetical protein EDB85DRAFT_1032954 [Lactarius pseudohatsudake]
MEKKRLGIGQLNRTASCCGRSPVQPVRYQFPYTSYGNCHFHFSAGLTACLGIVAVLRPNKTPLEGKVQSKICQRISEWAWWVRKYRFAVTKYLYALMDPYRIDGPVGSGPIIRSHHSLEYSRQTGNTIMGRRSCTVPARTPPIIRNSSSLLQVNTPCFTSTVRL